MERGFSLMELMVVIAIMAILVGIALPSYSHYSKRAHYTQIVQATAAYKLAVSLCFQHHPLSECKSGHYGIPNTRTFPPRQLVQNIVVSSNGVITATPKPKQGFLSSDTYILTPHAYEHHLSWQASGPAVEKNYVKR